MKMQVLYLLKKKANVQVGPCSSNPYCSRVNYIFLEKCLFRSFAHFNWVICLFLFLSLNVLWASLVAQQ